MRHQEEAAKPPLNGADGVVWSRNFWTTPPRLHELMRLRDLSGIARPNPDGPPPAEEGSSRTTPLVFHLFKD